jgi:cellulose synthase/poly-beta-1,6-N-acetylglucosamine synthase-like glycosyltransferase
MLLDVLICFTILYTLQILLYAVAAWRSRYAFDRSYFPTVSIIIAARNEENNIGRCLESMVRLTYPQHLLEIVVVDDHSKDDTRTIVNRYAQVCPRISIVTTRAEEGPLRGKTNAVTHGIESSTGEIIIFTDADCSVPERWVEETVKYYVDNNVGVVAGFTSLNSRNWFGAMQAIDWFSLFSVAAAMIRLRYPVTAVGNNLSVRRAAYDAVGGYRKIPFSVTEDYALFHAITTDTDYSARMPMDPDAVVHSQPCETGRELYRQKKRWFTGGRDMAPADFLIFSLSYVASLLILLGILLTGSATAWGALGIKTIVDLVLILPALSTFRRWPLLLYFPIFEIYYFLYVLYYPPRVLMGGAVVWKERSFRDASAE